MKNFKLVLDRFRDTLLSLIRASITFFSYICGWLKHHPGQTIMILLGMVAVFYAARSYYHNVRESEEAKKTTVTLQARIDFNHIYFSNFDYKRIYGPKTSWDDPWPEHASELREFRLFGLKPLI